MIKTKQKIVAIIDLLSGELLSRGHNVMIGYWRDEQKTKESINESKWYKSGYISFIIIII
jgi:long-subunit acyl-CoA synthetase (AMP-forming)